MKAQVLQASTPMPGATVSQCYAQDRAEEHYCGGAAGASVWREGATPS